MTKEQYDFLMHTINKEAVISIDTPLQTEAGDNIILADCLEDSTNIEHDAIEADCQSRLWEIIDDVLNDKQKDVITSYYLNQRTFTEIAEETGVSRQRINQIKEKLFPY